MFLEINFENKDLLIFWLILRPVEQKTNGC
jgi:hypothetical protein